MKCVFSILERCMMWRIIKHLVGDCQVDHAVRVYASTCVAEQAESKETAGHIATTTQRGRCHGHLVLEGNISGRERHGSGGHLASLKENLRLWACRQCSQRG